MATRNEMCVQVHNSQTSHCAPFRRCIAGAVGPPLCQVRRRPGSGPPQPLRRCLLTSEGAPEPEHSVRVRRDIHHDRARCSRDALPSLEFTLRRPPSGAPFAAWPQGAARPPSPSPATALPTRGGAPLNPQPTTLRSRITLIHCFRYTVPSRVPSGFF